MLIIDSGELRGAQRADDIADHNAHETTLVSGGPAIERLYWSRPRSVRGWEWICALPGPQAARGSAVVNGRKSKKPAVTI
jgi:hypothetical protein